MDERERERERERSLTKDPSINKVQQTEVLQQVILYGSAREQYSAVCPQLCECCVSLVLTVLETVTLK